MYLYEILCGEVHLFIFHEFPPDSKGEDNPSKWRGRFMNALGSGTRQNPVSQIINLLHDKARNSHAPLLWAEALGLVPDRNGQISKDKVIAFPCGTRGYLGLSLQGSGLLLIAL